MKSCLPLACLVHSGALLVSVNIKLAEGLQTVKTLVFGLRYAGWSLQLSNVKPTQSAMGAPQRKLWAQGSLWKVWHITIITAYWQSVSLSWANNITSQLMFAFTGWNRFISIENAWHTLQNSKTTHDAYLGLDLSIYVNQSSIHLQIQSL